MLDEAKIMSGSEATNLPGDSASSVAETGGAICFSKKGEFVTRSIAGETILVPVRGQVGDLDAIYNLNEVGSFIWERVNGITNVRQIADAVTAEFEVAAEQAENDTLQFIRSLQTAGIIEQIRQKD